MLYSAMLSSTLSSKYIYIVVPLLSCRFLPLLQLVACFLAVFRRFRESKLCQRCQAPITQVLDILRGLDGYQVRLFREETPTGEEGD